eukprot:tig00000405_g494.t1
MSVVAIPAITIQWFLFGYSVTYAPDGGSRIYGDLRWGGLKDVGGESNPDYAENIPHALFMTYQMMFAIITPALISGAVVGRMSFRDIVAHWVWAAAGCRVAYAKEGPSVVCAWKGWLRELGVVDFGGGLVVHLTAGMAALASAVIIGRRKAFEKPLVPHNVSLIVLGACLLWFGWFGFNGGNGYLSDDVAAVAVANTQLSAATGLATWMALEYLHDRKISASQASVVGLIVSTPNSGFVELWAAFLIGIIGAACSFYAIKLRQRLTLIDDTLDVFSCHGVGGVVGPLCTGLFATKKVNPLGPDGAFYGNGRLLGVQLLAVLVVAALSISIAVVTLLAIKKTIGLRVDPTKEIEGVDSITHGEARPPRPLPAPPRPRPGPAAADAEGSTRMSLKEFVSDAPSAAVLGGSLRNGAALASVVGGSLRRAAAAAAAEGGSLRGKFSCVDPADQEALALAASGPGPQQAAAGAALVQGPAGAPGERPALGYPASYPATPATLKGD